MGSASPPAELARVSRIAAQQAKLVAPLVSAACAAADSVTRQVRAVEAMFAPERTVRDLVEAHLATLRKPSAARDVFTVASGAEVEPELWRLAARRLADRLRPDARSWRAELRLRLLASVPLAVDAGGRGSVFAEVEVPGVGLARVRSLSANELDELRRRTTSALGVFAWLAARVLVDARGRRVFADLDQAERALGQKSVRLLRPIAAAALAISGAEALESAVFLDEVRRRLNEILDADLAGPRWSSKVDRRADAEPASGRYEAELVAWMDEARSRARRDAELTRASVDARDREILDLSDQGLSAPQIAEQLGMKPAAVRKARSRARQKLA